MSLSIVSIGNFRAPWCSEVHFARELESLGHTVERMQEPSNPSYHARFLRQVEHWCRTHEPDLLMFTRTWGLPKHTTELWRRLEARGIVTCSYHLDLYRGLQREAGIDDDPFWTTQHVFTPDGDPTSAEFFASKGINHHWSPPAVVSDECVPGMWQDKYNYDVVFVGSEGYHPEWPWRGQLISFLRERYGDRFRRFGGDCPEGPTRGKDLNDLYATAKVVVGDSLALPGHQNYFSDRYFETVGRGGFLVAPYVEGIGDFLQDGNHYVAYHHPRDGDVQAALEEVAVQVDYRLDGHPESRQRIATTGQAHVARHHTYRNRLSAALAVMGFGTLADDGPSLVNHVTAVQAPIERLELGAGYNPTSGFTTLDMNPACNPDIVGPAWPLDLPDNSVGEIRAVDVLEHISYHHSDEVLADWFRVLRPGGKIYIQVPDAAEVMKWYIEGEDATLIDRTAVNGPVTPLLGVAWRLLGGHDDGRYVKGSDDWRLNAHYSLWSEDSLAEMLVSHGFNVDDMRVNGHPNILCWASKPA